jgi:UDP-glucuronate decarboxylase
MTGREANIWHLQKNPAFELVRRDIAEAAEISGEIGSNIEEIYNLACPASPVHYQSDPVRTLKTSVWGAFNMLETARKTGAKVLQASMSEIYGDAEVHPQPESYKGRVNPIGIRACYDEGKRAAETLFFDYHRTHQTRIKVVRIFNTYGIDAIYRMMHSHENFTGPVNIGNPGEFTALELAEKILALTGSRSKLAFEPLPQDDLKQRKPDITLAKTELHGEPKVPLEDGLKKTIDWFRRE